MAKRSTKYGILFILLTFVTLWLFEIVAGVRIHPIQYLLIGSLCLFLALGTVMFITRKIDWYSFRKPSGEIEEKFEWSEADGGSGNNA
jgi:inner membrane protein